MLRIGLTGADPHAHLTPVRRLPGKVNYLIGNNRSDWHTGIPTYSAVRYRHVWPGIGARFYGHGGRLEYDFDVAAGADPGRIGLTLSGDQGVTVQPGGSLLVKLPGGHVRQLVPRAYQQTPGGGRQPVEAGYRLRPGGRVSIRLGRYDHSRPLVVDPVLLYVSYLGGTDYDVGTGVSTIPGSGGAWVTGATFSGDFPVTGDAAQSSNPTGPGVGTVFVAKLNDANQITYVSYLGGNGADGGLGVSATASGGAWVTGSTNSLNFPVTANGVQSSNPGLASAFAVRLNANGTLAYGTYLGGTLIGDIGEAISTTPDGGAWITGITYSATGFPTTANAIQSSNPTPGNQTGFVVKLNANGTLAYGTYLGGNGSDQPLAISATPSGGAWIDGYTNSDMDFPVTGDALQSSKPSPGASGFVVKLNAGGTLAYGSYLGGNVGDLGWGISATSDGGAWVTGATASTDFPVTANAVQDTFSGPQAAFAVKLNPDGTIGYATYLGGLDTDQGGGISTTPEGGAWVTGFTDSPIDFPLTPNAAQDTLTGQAAFAVKLNPDGSLAYGTYLGGTGTDQATGISATSVGGAWITGYTDSDMGFPVTANAYQKTYGGGLDDAFVARIGESIAITKTASVSQVAPGGTVTYTLHILNRTGGAISGTGAQVTDDLSHVLDNATWAGNAHASTGTVSFNAASKQLHWTGTLAGGATATITYSVHVHTGLTGGLLSNAADSPNGAICQGAPTALTPCTTVTPIVPTPPSQPPPTAPDLVLTKTASVTQANPGDQIAYQLLVQNRGNGNATGVTLQDAIPPGLQVTQAVPGQGTCHTNGILTCQLGTIPAGGEAIVQLTATISLLANGTITNTANVAADQPSTHPAGGTSTSQVQIIPPATTANGGPQAVPPQPVSDLVVTGNASHTRVRRGQQVNYTFTVTNHGPATAHNVRVRLAMRLPAQVLQAIATRGGHCTSQRPIVCTIPTIPAHGHATIRIRTRATVAGDQLVTACATSPNHDPHPETAVARVAGHVIPRPDITITATPDRIHPGQTSQLRIHVSNVNGLTLHRLATCVTLPTGLTYTGPESGATTTGNRRCWPLNHLADQRTHDYTTRVRAAATATTAAANLRAARATTTRHPIAASVTARDADSAQDHTQITVITAAVHHQRPHPRPHPRPHHQRHHRPPPIKPPHHGHPAVTG